MGSSRSGRLAGCSRLPALCSSLKGAAITACGLQRASGDARHQRLLAQQAAEPRRGPRGRQLLDRRDVRADDGAEGEERKHRFAASSISPSPSSPSSGFTAAQGGVARRPTGRDSGCACPRATIPPGRTGWRGKKKRIWRRNRLRVSATHLVRVARPVWPRRRGRL